MTTMIHPHGEFFSASERFDLREEVWKEVQQSMRMTRRQRAIVTLAINGVPDFRIAMILRLPLSRVHIEWLRLQLRNRTTGKVATLTKFLTRVAEIHHRSPRRKPRRPMLEPTGESRSAA